MRHVMRVLMSPDHDGHRFLAEVHDYDPVACATIIAWCEEHFGPHPPHNDNYVGSRWVGDSAFWFREEIDAFQFKMRWC